MASATLSQELAPHTNILHLSSLQLPVAPDPKLGPVRYVLYARKSSEEDERQALSIDSQIKEMQELAKREKLDVVEIRRESHSAKASGARPVFSQLLKDIRSGMFSGILTWAPDRLSRNAGDLGTVVDLIDQKHLVEIRTHGQRFSDNPNEKFLLMILCSQAKLENDNRGLNVKRGQRSRSESGYRPCLSPLGFLNEKNVDPHKSRIVIDKVRGPVVRKMFEHVAYNGSSGRTLLGWLNDEMGFRTRTGKKIVLSAIYKILRNPFYCGKFEYPIGSGKWYKGDYEPLVTESLFKEVQKLLDMAPKKERGIKEFHFVKMFLCGGCGSGVTAEDKIKRLKDGTIKKYIYYRCTKSRCLTCKEGSIREDILLEQLTVLIDRLDLDELGMKDRLQEELTRFEKFTTGVLGMTMGGVNAMPKIDLKTYAKYILKEGAKDEKRDLLACLQSRLLLKDGNIVLQEEEKKPKRRK